MTKVVEIPRLRELIVDRLTQKYSKQHSELMADSILFGELIGRPSHGISRLLPGSYGVMDEEAGDGSPSVEKTSPMAARVVGAPGILVASMAVSLAIELAAENGMSVVATTGSHSTSGSLTYYVEQMTSRDMVGLMAANTASFATPPGGRERILGTNPIAVGVPAVGYPFIFDMATTAISGGEVLAAAQAGVEIPPGTAVDVDGEPTTDPQAVLGGGALLPFDGHKGLGLSMMVQLLSGVLAGRSVLPIGPQDDWSHVFVAISLAALGDPEHLRQTSQHLIDRIATTLTQDGVEIRIPGHRSLRTRDETLSRGTVEVDTLTLDQLLDLL